MFELTEIATAGDLRDHVFPVILQDANIYDAMGRLTYIRHWENGRTRSGRIAGYTEVEFGDE